MLYVPICIIGELHEREAAADLLREGDSRLVPGRSGCSGSPLAAAAGERQG